MFFQLQLQQLQQSAPNGRAFWLCFGLILEPYGHAALQAKQR
jgi:hypothetical protein